MEEALDPFSSGAALAPARLPLRRQSRLIHGACSQTN